MIATFTARLQGAKNCETHHDQGRRVRPANRQDEVADAEQQNRPAGSGPIAQL